MSRDQQSRFDLVDIDYDENEDDDYIPTHDDQLSEEEEDDDDDDSQDADQDLEGEGLENDDNTPDVSNRNFLNLLRLYGSMRRHHAVNNFAGLSSDDEEDPAGWSASKGGFRDRRVPVPQGSKLLRSGEFGRIQSYSPQNICVKSFHQRIHAQRLQTRLANRQQICANVVPSSNGTVVAAYSSRAYVGQFSTDSSFYYTGCQDFSLRIYDTTAPITPLGRASSSWYSEHRTSMKLTKMIPGSGAGWTLTDSHLSPDNSALLYSTFGSTLYIVKTQESDEEQIQLPLTRSANQDLWYSSVPVFSCRFSADGKEVIAGGGSGSLFVYDLGKMRRTLHISAHDDDINSCCWADTSSGNVLVSASDDTSLKVWDRRSLGSSHKPSGVLIGHTEGITHVAPRGDGRYVISNGKDQVLRLWDLRKMRNHNEWTGRNPYGHNGFDYRYPPYPKPRHAAHPLDASVMTYKGHSVMRTLIRCHFSPVETTGGAYIYSGSFDGLIHIWSLDGTVVQVLDRSKTSPITTHPSGADQPAAVLRRANPCVRDVAWHPNAPILMSCAWNEDDASTVAMHEWKGFGKNSLSLTDVVEREQPSR